MNTIEEYKNKEFKKYIREKRVVFVGACPNLLGRGMGEKIDSYDIVVRSNNFWKPIQKAWIKDYGQRCDVVYVNVQYVKKMRPFPIAEMKERGLSWVIFKGLNINKLAEYNTIINARTYNHVISRVSQKILSATAGLYLAFDILENNPAEFYYTGVDFFASRKPKFEFDNYQEYLPGYLPDKIRAQGNIINIGKMVDSHDFLGNAQIFFDLFNTYKNFKTDDFIFELLYRIVKKEINQGEITWQ